MNIKIIHIKWLISFLLCLLCTSCWSSGDIEEQIYISAIGVDIKDDEYIIYAQVQNFQSIVQYQPRKNNESSSTYVGIGKGKSMYEAALNLARSSQGKIDWGHVEALVVSEEVMKRDNINIPRKIYRYPDTRYNSWFYVTSEDIYKILTLGNIYDESTLSSTLFKPVSVYKQKSTVKPLLSFDFVAKLSEPDRTVAVPYITINDEQWKSAETTLELLEIGGVYFATLNGTQKMYALEDLPGFVLSQIPSRSAVSIKDEEEILANFIVRPKKKSVDVEAIGSSISFKFTIRYLAGMYEFKTDLTYDETVKKLEQTITEQLKAAYLLGVENEVDIFSLMTSLRQKYPHLWRELTDHGRQFILDESSLEQINVKVVIPYNGKYKRRSEELQN